MSDLSEIVDCTDDVVVFRRDGDPHRAHLLYPLACAGVALSLVPIIGVALPLLIFLLARRDYVMIRLGNMDYQGLRSTKAARYVAWSGLLVGVGAHQFYAVLIVVLALTVGF